MSSDALINILLGAAVVVGVIAVLVAALLLFQRALVPRGPFLISFADGASPDLPVMPVGSLLETLRGRGIVLPSACGEAGTCGRCKIRILEGGGSPLPLERAQLTRREIADGWRLACQARLRGDVRLVLPSSRHTAREIRGRVSHVRDAATFIRELTIALPEAERIEFTAGDYVQVHVPAYQRLRLRDVDLAPELRDVWDAAGLLELVASNPVATTRAYSLANPPVQDDRLVFNVRIAAPPRDAPGAPPGVASSFLYGLAPGDELTVSGPFGEFHVRDSARELIYLGGGAGMAPLRSQLLHLLETEQTQRRLSFWYGARARRELLYHQELTGLAAAHANFSYHPALSDPLAGDDWTGPVGFIHQVALDHYLADHPAPHEVDYYLCGPPPMMTATLEMLAELGVGPEQIRFDDFAA